MEHRRVTLIIYGMGTYLGREVARFGRAMGHRIVGVVRDSIPPFEHPWMHGIHWVRDGEVITESWSDGPPAAIIYADTALWDGDRHRFQRILVQRPQELAEEARHLEPAPRFVLRSTIDQPFLSSRFTAHNRRAEQVIAESNLPYAILRFPLLYGEERPDSVAAMMMLRALRRMPLGPYADTSLPTMPVETAALACLRAALEPDISGIFGPQEIARIGDVMIAQ